MRKLVLGAYTTKAYIYNIYIYYMCRSIILRHIRV